MKIEIDNKTYKLDVKGAMEAKLLVPIRLYSIGQRFTQTWNGEIYMLARVDTDLVLLMSIENGTRWGPPKLVANPRAITEEEFKEIANNDEDFVFIPQK